MKQDDINNTKASYEEGFHNGSESHRLNTVEGLISRLFKKYDGLNVKIEELKEVVQPKPPTMLTIIGGIASIFIILATLVGTVVNITKSSLAPVNAKIEQLDGINKKIEKLNTQQHIQESNFQSAIERIEYNKSTIDWFLKEENFPMLVYQNTEKINAIGKHNKERFNAVNKYFEEKLDTLNEFTRSKTMKGKK